eukprot:m.32593 g.32593  ORF g.32593 m.32593 type:complete len:750 (+) comp8429_c0_seq2:165-2414(+)
MGCAGSKEAKEGDDNKNESKDQPQKDQQEERKSDAPPVKEEEGGGDACNPKKHTITEKPKMDSRVEEVLPPLAPVEHTESGEASGSTSGGLTAPENTNDGMWTDPDFPPNDRSLCGGNFPDGQNWQKYKWRRAKDIFDGAFKVFEGIHPDDIQQGALGDCYFLGALACLAEDPKRIEKLFVTKDINKEGKYTVEFYKVGQKVTVTVDDWFPCVSESGGPAFSRAKGNELWVLIMEKAWAKVHHNYLNVEAGRIGNALGDLTGAPHTDILWREEGDGLGTGTLNVDEVWGKLLAAEGRSFPSAASVPDIVTRDMEKEFGLVEKHAYSILDVRELQGGSLRLIKCRNPWGHGEWKGDWSDKSPLWTSALKREVDFVDEDDGSFWMAFKDFCMCFAELSILHLDEKNHRQATKMFPIKSQHTSQALVKITTNKPSKAFVCIHQHDKRLVVGKKAGSEYGGIRFEIFNNGNHFVTHSDPAKSRDYNVETELPEGDNVVMFWADFPQETQRECCLSVHASNAIANLEQISVTEEERVALLQESHKDAAKRLGKVLKDKDGLITKAFEYSGGHILLYENDTDSMILKGEVSFELTNAFVAAPDEGTVVQFEVEPKKGRVIRVHPMEIGASWAYRLRRSSALERAFDEGGLGTLAIEAKEKGEGRDYGRFGAANIVCYTYQFNTGVCLLYTNNEEKLALDETVTFKLQNMEIVGREGETEVKVEVAPQEEELIVVKTIETGAYSFSTYTDSQIVPV